MHKETEEKFNKLFIDAMKSIKSIPHHNNFEIAKLKSFISTHFIDKRTLKEEIEKEIEIWLERIRTTTGEYAINGVTAPQDLKERFNL